MSESGKKLVCVVIRLSRPSPNRYPLSLNSRPTLFNTGQASWHPVHSMPYLRANAGTASARPVASRKPTRKRATKIRPRPVSFGNMSMRYLLLGKGRHGNEAGGHLGKEVLDRQGHAAAMPKQRIGERVAFRRRVVRGPFRDHAHPGHWPGTGLDHAGLRILVRLFAHST